MSLKTKKNMSKNTYLKKMTLQLNLYYTNIQHTVNVLFFVLALCAAVLWVVDSAEQGTILFETLPPMKS